MGTIDVHDLGKRYGKLWALQGVNASFHAGETVAVIGPNGSGKSTLIKILLGLVRSTTGHIDVLGLRAGGDPESRARIGYMAQIARYPETLRISDLLNMMRDVRGLSNDQLDDTLVRDLGLSGQLNKRMGALSGGTRQKVSAVLAFRTRPEVLVLDEPTAGLDPASAARLIAEVGHARERGCTVLITSHLMDEVGHIADRIAYLGEGRLRFLLSPTEILASTGTDRLSQGIANLLTPLPA